MEFGEDTLVIQKAIVHPITAIIVVSRYLLVIVDPKAYGKRKAGKEKLGTSIVVNTP
jgi:hypothetical protein